MAASYPKPDNQRRRRNAPTFDWVELPATPNVAAPKLPPRKWDSATKKWWLELWSKPQAAMWDSSGSTLWVLATLYDDLFAGRTEAARVSGEIRQHEDRHGLNPKAMLQLRWRIAASEPGEVVDMQQAAARRRIKAVDPDAVERT